MAEQVIVAASWIVSVIAVGVTLGVWLYRAIVWLVER